MILVQTKLLNRKDFDKDLKEYFITGKTPKDTAINKHNGNICFEVLDDNLETECNLFCEEMEGYEVIG